MYLQVWVGLLAVQYLTRTWCPGRVNWRRILLLLLLLLLMLMLLLLLLLLLLRMQVCLRFGRGLVLLAVLEMLNLARRVLRAHEATMQTSHFIAF
jgi:hypothetical protein